MKTLLRQLFMENWPRKAISVVLAIIIWLVVNHSLTMTKTLSNIPVKVINIPSSKTIEGIHSNGLLPKRVTLSLVGNKTLLEELTPDDIEVVIDASEKQQDWTALITKKNLVSLNPELDLSKGISRVVPLSFAVHLTNVVTERLSITVTQPIGDAPRGYQFLDVWPYHLEMTVTGPEEIVKKLKAKDHKLTFNLNDITKTELDNLQPHSTSDHTEVISFFVPQQWKQLLLPSLCDVPIEIDDSAASTLRIDFVRYNMVPLEKAIPVSLFFPPEYATTLNPSTISLAQSDLIKKQGGLPMITTPLYAKGVSRLFLQIVRDMIEIVVIVVPNTVQGNLDWSVQFIDPRILENKYVAELASGSQEEEVRDLQPNVREDYWRNRFRSYMHHFQLFKADDTKFNLNIELIDNKVYIQESSK